MAGYALPETVYLREDRGFLTDARDPDRPDLVARRVAHEVAHQWFGHRVHTANVEGASMIVESLAKYSELLIVERMRGREQVRQLLEIELDQYLSGRAGETYAEVPLYRVDSQPYLFYNKAAVVLFAIRDLLGQEAMDRAIRAMMREPRPTSADLVRHLRAVADAGQGALIDQWTREIVLYDLRVDAARTRRRADGRYDVTVRVAAGKSRAEGRGNEQPLAFDEPDRDRRRHRYESARLPPACAAARDERDRAHRRLAAVVRDRRSMDHADRPEPGGQCEAVLSTRGPREPQPGASVDRVGDHRDAKGTAPSGRI